MPDETPGTPPEESPSELPSLPTGNQPAPQKRILGMVSEELLEAVKDLSAIEGVTQQHFVGQAVAYFVQQREELLEAELLIRQLAQRQKVHPDALMVAALKSFLVGNMDKEVLADLYMGDFVELTEETDG